MGFLFKAFIDGIIKTINAIKIKKENEQKFKQVLDKIRNGKSKFKTRINNTVYITTTLNETEDVSLILFLDTKKVAIFKKDICLNTSDSISEELRKEIVKEIEDRYGIEIEDTVELLGNKIWRKEVEDKISEVMQSDEVNSKLEELRQYLANNDIIVSEDYGYTQEDVDAIFDKIAKSGMKSITDDEKKILDDYSKNLK
jgi:pentose-5-phosphate-3-epimerase